MLIIMYMIQKLNNSILCEDSKEYFLYVYPKEGKTHRWKSNSCMYIKCIKIKPWLIYLAEYPKSKTFKIILLMGACHKPKTHVRNLSYIGQVRWVFPSIMYIPRHAIQSSLLFKLSDPTLRSSSLLSVYIRKKEKPTEEEYIKYSHG